MNNQSVNSILDFIQITCIESWTFADVAYFIFITCLGNVELAVDSFFSD
jgi:hypothetical protein